MAAESFPSRSTRLSLIHIFNYLVGMIYGQLIQTLYFVADRKYKGRLPVPVHLLIDEAPNIALPTDLSLIHISYFLLLFYIPSQRTDCHDQRE